MRPIKKLFPTLSILFFLSLPLALTLPTPSPSPSSTFPHDTQPNPRSLPTRVFNHQNIRPLYFATLQVLLPADPAIAQLEALYTTILQHAQSSWNGLQPRDSFVVRYNQLELAFLSVEGGVDWSFVAEFAATMLQTTRMGFAGTFQQTWAGAAGASSTISVILRLRT